MENIIETISTIEQSAQRITEAANNRKRDLDQEQAVKIAEFDAKIDEDTNSRLSVLRKELKEDTDRELEAVKTTSKETLASLENWFNNSQEKIATEIFEKIIRK